MAYEIKKNRYAIMSTPLKVLRDLFCLDFPSKSTSAGDIPLDRRGFSPEYLMKAILGDASAVAVVMG